jgi:hypothetical protein
MLQRTARVNIRAAAPAGARAPSQEPKLRRGQKNTLKSLKRQSRSQSRKAAAKGSRISALTEIA